MLLRTSILIATIALLGAGCAKPQTQASESPPKRFDLNQTKPVDRPAPVPPVEKTRTSEIIIHATPTPEPAPAPIIEVPTPAPKSEPSPNVQVRRRFFFRAGLSGWWDRKVQQGRRWTDFTSKALDEVGGNLLTKVPSDAADWCPGFEKLDREGRKAFWVAFVSAMAVFESSFNPQAKHQEKFNDANGDKVISRGLLQLSVESAQGFGCSWIDKAQDLHDPELNLKCGVKILNRHVGADNRIFGHNVKIDEDKTAKWMGTARYWGIFRLESRRTAIQRAVKRLKICQPTPEDVQNTHQITVVPMGAP
jgi:hypothetical protein